MPSDIHPRPRRLIPVKPVAEKIGVSVPSVWKAVRQGRLPLPVYPVARSPRWFEDEIDAALEATRALPRDAQAARRAAATKAA